MTGRAFRCPGVDPEVAVDGPQSIPFITSIPMSMTLEELARLLGAELRGDGTHVVSGCAGLEEAGADDVSFLANRRYAHCLATTRAGAVILSKEDADQLDNGSALIAEDPYFAFREAMVAMYGFRPRSEPGISEQAIVHPGAKVAASCSVQDFAFIAANARLGERCVVYPHCYIGENVVIGDDCTLFPNVTIYESCVLGDRVHLHAGCVIGQDGFGYATHEGSHHKIPQVGNVVIEDDVELGANCAVDRATVGSTVIGAGTKLSDLVAIGHGTRLGSHNLIVAQVGLAGSVQTGSHVVMGGQVGVAGHLKIGDGVQIAAKSALKDDVEDHVVVGGAPAMPLQLAKRNYLAFMRLGEYVRDLRRMKKQVEKLQRRLDETKRD